MVTQPLIIPSSILSAPVQLWVGTPHDLQTQTITYLQQIFCSKKGCGSCTQCNAIAQQQFYNCMWLMPEKQYTLERIQPIFDQIQFALDTHEKFFFIITKAEALSLAAANALLKSLEEPAAGYHFILHTTNQQAIIPTIRSRSVIFTFNCTPTSIQHQRLFEHFTTTPLAAPLFMQELEQSKITEQETMALLEHILNYWLTRYKTALAENNNQLQQSSLHTIDILKQQLHTPPMPGSAKLFWKNLFLLLL